MGIKVDGFCEVKCDGKVAGVPCRRSFTVTRYKNREDVVEQAQSRGWVFTNGKAFCSKCNTACVQDLGGQ